MCNFCIPILSQRFGHWYWREDTGRMENLRRLMCWFEQIIILFVYLRFAGPWLMPGILLCCISSYLKADSVWGSMKEINEVGKLESDRNGDGLEMGRAEINGHCNPEIRFHDTAIAGREGQKAEDKDQKASLTSKEDEDRPQELTSECDHQDDDVEMPRALLEKEKQCLAGHLVELANVLPQKLRECQRVVIEERSSKWDEEKEGLIAKIERLQELYRDKERCHRHEVLLRNQERNELSGKLMTATQKFRQLYKQWIEEKRELAAQLDGAISSSEYYRAYFYDVYQTCHKLKEDNTLLSDELSELEDKCSRLEEDKQNLIVSLEAAKASTEIYRAYTAQLMYLSPWVV